MRIRTGTTAKEKVNYLAIGFVNKIGLPLQMDRTGAKKLAIAATINPASAVTETYIAANPMFAIMVWDSATLNGSSPILESMVAKNLVTSAERHFTFMEPQFCKSRNRIVNIKILLKYYFNPNKPK